MKKFVILANCQGGALTKTLFNNHEFSCTYELLRILPVQHLKDKDIPDVIEKLGQADLFIYQPIAATPKRPNELSSAFLLKKTNPKAITISIPSIYFDGYFPHLKTLKGHVSVLNLIHDYFIAYSCAIGLSEEKTLELMQKEDLYPKKLSVGLAEQSIMELRSREEEFGIDMTLSEFIEKNYQHTRLFNHFSHPKTIVFKHLAEKILNRCAITSPLVRKIGNQHLLNDFEPPIYRSTYKHLNLQFAEDFDTYNGSKINELSQQTVVSSFFDFYRQQDLELIKKIVINNKPFVPELVESHL